MNKRKFMVMGIVGVIVSIAILYQLREYVAVYNRVEQVDVSPQPMMAAPSPILVGKTIVIDAGHGGKDAGAIGQSGINEKDLTLQTALNIKQELETRTGAKVILTRKEDDFLSLAERADLSNEQKADLFISLHCDAFEEGSVGGITSYYYRHEDYEVAQTIHSLLYQDFLQTRDRGVLYGDFQVLRDNEAPSVLLELGYISNVEDENRIQSHLFQTHAAKSITDGIITFLLKDK
ncbi:N-acetylmuramoyl-L-alanine amidase [Paenibacillus sp. N1-5-1-14]|uniref:N-acetylmuramoyl-L-alanine amidase family protein n=1 Tax=Paenibacillus radicibacter TaxID=2972488 RepID=UPI00215982E6|nr:N-acetylmuramoyl-L-alanine amidase [Paenibacillus radicibacter]MCR8642213.1 N-acetylmuramoyl-L-alanine amidase [Paenibacillus radicibacter]